MNIVEDRKMDLYLARAIPGLLLETVGGADSGMLVGRATLSSGVTVRMVVPSVLASAYRIAAADIACHDLPLTLTRRDDGYTLVGADSADVMIRDGAASHAAPMAAATPVRTTSNPPAAHGAVDSGRPLRRAA